MCVNFPAPLLNYAYTRTTRAEIFFVHLKIELKSIFRLLCVCFFSRTEPPTWDCAGGVRICVTDHNDPPTACKPRFNSPKVAWPEAGLPREQEDKLTSLVVVVLPRITGLPTSGVALGEKGGK